MKKNCLVFYQKASKKRILQANSKEILVIGYAVTDLAGYAKFILEILDFCNVKPQAFVKLTNLATISNFNFNLFVYI